MIDKRQFVTRVTEWENHQNWTTFESKIYKGTYQKRLIYNPFIVDHKPLKNSKKFH